MVEEVARVSANSTNVKLVARPAGLRATPTTMPIRIVTVDAFTNVPFAGNPAAVCVMQEPRSEEWLRSVAREMNLSETAFLIPRDGEFDLRWLTPSIEVDLCGHATVASAHVLWEDGHLPAGKQARFHTRSGLLTADRRGDWIELDFPVKIATVAGANGMELAARARHSRRRWRSQRTCLDYLVEIESEEEVRALQLPDHSLLRKTLTCARRNSDGALFHAGIRFCIAVLRAGLGRG